MTLSTHVLDAGRGQPARGVPVQWDFRPAGGREWAFTAFGVTDPDGRVGAGDWLVPGRKGHHPDVPERVTTAVGDHRLIFATGVWFLVEGIDGFYPEVVVTVSVSDPGDHHHVPLLLSPFSYTTYRGS